MRAAKKIVLLILFVFAAVLSWGYWHSLKHAYLNLQIEDYGLQTDRQAFGTPRGAILSYFDAEGKILAFAHSVASHEYMYLAAVHPDKNVGDCLQYQNSRNEYAKCYAIHSAWAASWAPRVCTATVNIGKCILKEVPVKIDAANDEWWLWWIPHPHIGGVPRQSFQITARVNSVSCTTPERQAYPS